MQPLTLEEILFVEEATADVVSTIRARVRDGHEPMMIINATLATGLSPEQDYMGRDDYLSLYAVALWMLAKTDGPVDDGS